MASVFEDYYNWMYDGDMKSEIPKEVLKPSSPISQKYAISVFLMSGNLNYYLNEYFNNIRVWYIDKEDLFLFLKKCVKDFRVSRKSLVYVSWKKTDKLYEELRKRIPFLKEYEITHLCEIVEKSEEKEMIYSSLGLDKVEKVKVKKEKKQKNDKDKKISVVDFVKQNFSIVEIEQ